jgi:hypothetical protein
MARHVGIVACSAEGAALCYRTLCSEAPVLMGEHMHPEVSMHTHPLAEYMVHIRAGAWDEVAALMLSSARKLAGIDLALMGGTSNIDIVRGGTPETIEADVAEKLACGIDILGPECAVPLDAPWRNMRAFVDEARRATAPGA